MTYRGMRPATIPVVVTLALFAPGSRLLAFNGSYFELTALEALLSLSVAGLLLSIPLVALALQRSLRPAIGAFLSALLVASALTSFVIPVRLGAIDGMAATALQVRTEALVATAIALLIVPTLALVARLRPAIGRRIDDVARILVLFSVLYTLVFSAYALASRPMLQPYSGKAPKAVTAPVSRERNIFIIGFDQIQGSYMRRYLEMHEEKARLMEGFTFYPDAAATYPNTHFSLGSLALGRIVASEQEGPRETSDSDQSILARAHDRGYAVYTSDFVSGERYRCVTCAESRQVFNVTKGIELLRHAVNLGFGVDPARMGVALPSTPSGVAAPELLDHAWKLDLHGFRELTRGLHVAPGAPALYYMHFIGTHQPFVYRSDCTTRSGGEIRDSQNSAGASDTIACVFSLLETFFQSLKSLGVYDNSAIFIFSDHGYERNLNLLEHDAEHRQFFPEFSSAIGDPRNIKPVGSYNPILFFKSPRSSGPLASNDSPVSLIDIAPTVCQLIGCDSEWQGVSLLGALPSGRVREFWQYLGGTNRRDADGSDRFHFRLDHWGRRSFEGPIYPNLAFGLGLDKRALLRRLDVGGTIDFGRDGNSAVYTTAGWSHQEERSRWTEGKEAKLKFRVDARAGTDLVMRLNGHGYLGHGIPHQEVLVEVNGRRVAEWKVGRPAWHEARIPFEALGKGQQEIVFRIGSPAAPCEVSKSGDCRKLGLSAGKLVIETASPSR